MKPIAALSLCLALMGFAAPPATAGNVSAPRSAALAVAPAPLNDSEKADLLWMREEEKLARDVYRLFYERWGQPAFQRIATAEQRHFDAIGARLLQFGLADPALPEAGLFTQPALQTLYQQLTFTGMQSLVQALAAGATIEDLDIADLVAALNDTTNPVLKRTYENLLEGSKNHLRAFVGLLRSLGSDYTPVYIDPLLFDAIMGD